MINLIYYIKIKHKYNYNRIKSIVKNNTISKLIEPIILLQNIFGTVSYNLILVVLAYQFNNLFIYLYILLTILGALNNTIMFKYTIYKKILLNNYLVDSKFIIIQYYYELLKEKILSIPFFLIISFITSLNYINIIQLIFFSINIKTILNMLLLMLYKRKGFIYNEDDPNTLVMLINILLIIIFIPLIILKINLWMFISVINIIGLSSHLYVIYFKKYDSLVSEMRYDEKDFSIKEVTKIEYKESKDTKESYKYLNNIFNKRYKKYYALTFFKSLVSLILLFLIYKITDINLLNIIRTTYLTNITSKIYEYYYYKSDRYFINYLDLKIHNERRKNINLLNLIINMFLIIICIIKKKYDLVMLVIILSNIITLTYININIFLKPFINNKRKVIYHIINNIISIMILLIENIKMNITNVYSISIISYLINYIIMKKYICKVKTS